MGGFGRRVTSAFRRDSRASIPDVLTDAASSSPRSRPATPDINETLSAPAPKANVEPAVAPAEPPLPDVAESTPAPVAEPQAAPAPEESKVESDVQPVPETVAVGGQSAASEEPEQSAYVLLAFSFKRKVRISGVSRGAAGAIVDEPEALEEALEAEGPIEVPEQVREMDHETLVERESPASSMPVPELHHQSSDSWV